jgi:hypothetical protein
LECQEGSTLRAKQDSFTGSGKSDRMHNRAGTGRTLPRRPHAARPAVVELEGLRVIERDDGYWVQAATSDRETGPYANLVEAIESQRASESEEDDLEPGMALAEVEAQLGVADWIDPETCEPAEDSVPHLEEH